MSNRRSLIALAAAALVAGLVALVVFLFASTPPPEMIVGPPPPPPPDETRPRVRDMYSGAAVGGAYEGTVVDLEGRPVRDADVLLVAVDDGAKATYEQYDASGNGESIDIPIFGQYRTAARGHADAAGRFSLAAGNARVVAIVAYEREFSPALLAHTEKAPLKPGPDHVMRLAPAGWLKGRVLDGVSHEPVGGVDVGIYLQGQANQTRAGPEPLTATNGFGIFQDYVARELGPLVWGIRPPPGDTGFHLVTTSDGWFTFGPVMKEAQVEVVLTHPEYMWTDSDPEVFLPQDNPASAADKKPLDRRRRTVVPPGEKVERTYYLQKGKEVRGTVVDSDGAPIPEVDIALEHVAQYTQHWRYRTTPRIARTDDKGRFRIAGLSFPPYNLRMRHPSFDTEWFSGVQADSDVPYKIQTAGGWIDLTVEDGPPNTPQWSARAWIEASDHKSPRREEPLVVHEGKVTIDRVKPGRYDLFLVSGTKVSTTAHVEVRNGIGTAGTVHMSAGGGIELSVRDASGAVVDPVTAELQEIGDGPASAGRRAAILVSREGLVSSQGLLPGRYVAEIRAPGFLTTRSEPFQVLAGASTSVPAVVMRRQAFVKITGVVGDDGRSLPGTVDVSLYVSEDGRDFERRKTLEIGLLPVVPGDVMLKAESTDGRRFEKTIHPADGETVPVEIRLSR